MIGNVEIPEEELGFLGNSSLFNYQINEQTLLNRKSIWDSFVNTDYEESLQFLDNGELIITQNIFGGCSIISKYTCGLYFCSQLSDYLSGISPDQEIDVTVGADDCHSGWDYDFNLKIRSTDADKLIVTKDYDFRVVVEYDRNSFLKNYVNFAKWIATAFEFLYPELSSNDKFLVFMQNNTSIILP